MSGAGKVRRTRLWGVGTPRTLRPIWVAEELGIAYDLEPIGPRTGETRTADFTRLNPRQKIPFMDDGGVRLSESVAISRYLIQAYPGEAIWRPRSRLERAREDEWCCYVYGEIDETALYVIRRHDDLAHIYGSAPQVVESARAYVRRHLDVIDAHLATREYLLEGGFGFADMLLTTCLEWARHCGIELAPAVAEYRHRITARPAYGRAREVNRPREV